jgi:4-amino-4-deoxy-L-arabinose transferase-like glycosyltransferase
MDLGWKKIFKDGVPSIALFIVAIIVRLVHNGYVMESPLYYLPLGGHVPYLEMAEKISGGDILPIDAPFSLNSPLYPYILALEFFFVGVDQLFLTRLFGIVLDSLTCVMVVIISRQHFGKNAGVAAGIIAAIYGPMIFYSAELIAVSHTLFFVTLGIYLLYKDGSPCLHLFSGLLIGIAVGTRPNLLILGVLIVSVPFVLRKKKRWTKSFFIGIGIALSILPIIIANYIASGKVVLLTTSAGHNFYIGHNPQAKAGYFVPDNLMGTVFSNKGSIFTNMKNLAEEVEGREFEDTEISSYYMTRAFGHIVTHPLSEARLLMKRIALAMNGFEATTYSDYYFQKELSPVLRFAPTLGFIFPLAALGMIMAFGRQYYILYLPILSTFLSILLFFCISRIRMPMIPFIVIFAGHGVSYLLSFLNTKQWNKTLLSALFIAPMFIFCNIAWSKPDSSNEWNKVGIVLRIQKRYEDAERAFIRARELNPTNPNTYLNLDVLYRTVGSPDKAANMRSMAKKLINRNEEEQFIETLKQRY